MHLVDGPFRHLSGRWTFTQLGDAGSKVNSTWNSSFQQRDRHVIRTVFRGYLQFTGRCIHARADDVFGRRTMTQDVGRSGFRSARLAGFCVLELPAERPLPSAIAASGLPKTFRNTDSRTAGRYLGAASGAGASAARWRPGRDLSRAC